jgi:hypothetical protein
VEICDAAEAQTVPIGHAGLHQIVDAGEHIIDVLRFWP